MIMKMARCLEITGAVRTNRQDTHWFALPRTRESIRSLRLGPHHACVTDTTVQIIPMGRELLARSPLMPRATGWGFKLQRFLGLF